MDLTPAIGSWSRIFTEAVTPTHLVDLAHARVLGRGRRVAKAKRSFETILIDKKVLGTLGGPEALMGILLALANSIEATRKRRRAA